MQIMKIISLVVLIVTIILFSILVIKENKRRKAIKQRLKNILSKAFPKGFPISSNGSYEIWYRYNEDYYIIKKYEPVFDKRGYNNGRRIARQCKLYRRWKDEEMVDEIKMFTDDKLADRYK